MKCMFLVADLITFVTSTYNEIYLHNFFFQLGTVTIVIIMKLVASRIICNDTSIIRKEVCASN